MNRMIKQQNRVAALAISAAMAAASLLPVMTAHAAEALTEGTFSGHPAATVLEKVFREKEPATFVPSKVSRENYLQLVAADVDYFKTCQRADGAIIDPYAHSEVQYATPSFALAAGTLVKESGRHDLLEPASRAMSCALTALVTHHAANQHSDFYIPLLVHTFEVLKDQVPAKVAAGWEKQFNDIVPEKIYRMDLRGMNWNIVSSCGELLRRKDGLVAPEQLDAQWKYLEESLQGHAKDITPVGLIEDPGAPMAYDAFSRVWLEEMMADGAYDGKLAATFEQSLKNGALSALLLLSPSGEWANGGRSGMHNWNEAENLLIFEIEANRWKKAGRQDVAGAFKRAAHLGFESMKRWQRPSGELWIIKNRAEPDQRLAFEPYSFHSQYNLLPMAMLAMAFEHADDSVAEHAAPAEVGGYVFDVEDHFHKVAAAAGGYYLLIDTAADPHYNATGLQRVHRSGVPFPALSDSAAAERAFGPKGGDKVAMTPGLAWKNSNDPAATWHSLADFSGHGGKWTVQSTTLHINESTQARVHFQLDYALAGPGEEGRHVVERYTLSGDGVKCDTTLASPTPPQGGFQATFPVLVSDGAQDLPISESTDSITIDDHGSKTTFRVGQADVKKMLELAGPRVATHSGYVQQATVPLSGPELRYEITLTNK